MKRHATVLFLRYLTVTPLLYYSETARECSVGRHDDLPPVMFLFCSFAAVVGETFVANQLLHSAHRVLLVKHKPLTIGRVQAISAYMLVASPVYVQLWRSLDDNSYVLDWQKELDAPQYFGHNVVST